MVKHPALRVSPPETSTTSTGYWVSPSVTDIIASSAAEMPLGPHTSSGSVRLERLMVWISPGRPNTWSP